MWPRFVTRLRWRSWAVVEAATLAPPPPAAAPVPARTVRRWRTRLASAACLLVGVLREHGSAAVAAFARTVDAAATRLQLVLAYAAALTVAALARLASVAAVIHDQAPGVRLM
jgi:hypothetical protein